jgi:hypothetical protein
MKLNFEDFDDILIELYLHKIVDEIVDEANLHHTHQILCDAKDFASHCHGCRFPSLIDKVLENSNSNNSFAIRPN